MEFGAAQTLVGSTQAVLECLRSDSMLHVAVGLEALTSVWKSTRNDGASFSAFQERLGRAGVVESVMNLIRSSPLDIQCQALAVLGFLMEHCRENQDRAREHGAVTLLISILQNITDSDDTDLQWEEKLPARNDGASTSSPARQLQEVDIVAVSTVFALGLAVGHNEASTKEALGQGLVQTLVTLLGSDISESIVVLLLTLAHMLLDMSTDFVEQLGRHGGLWSLLGIYRADSTSPATSSFILEKTACHLAILAVVAANSSPSAAAAYLEMGATDVCHSALQATVGVQEPWALHLQLNCAKLLNVLGRDQEGEAFLRSSLSDVALGALCQSVADANLEESSEAQVVEDLLERLLSAQDIDFFTRFAKAPGCLSAALQQPRTRAAIVKAASSWAVQLRLTGRGIAHSRSEDAESAGLDATVALALLCPYERRFAKAMLEQDRLSTLLSALLDELAPVSSLSRSSSVTSSPASPDTPKKLMETGPFRSFCEASFESSSACSEPDVPCLSRAPSLRRGLAAGEAAQALCAMVAWMTGHPEQQQAETLGKRTREEPRPSACPSSKRPCLSAGDTTFAKFSSGGVTVTCPVSALVGVSPLLDFLLETARPGECIPVPAVSDIKGLEMAKCMRWALEWLSGHSLQEDGMNLSATEALRLWRVADYLQVFGLQTACEEVIARGLHKRAVMLQAFSLAASHPSQGHEAGSGGLLAICIHFLARNLQLCIANGMLRHLVDEYRDLMQHHFVQELRSMLQGATELP